MNFLKESKDGLLAVCALLILYGYYCIKRTNKKAQKERRVVQSEHFKYLNRTFNH